MVPPILGNLHVSHMSSLKQTARALLPGKDASLTAIQALRNLGFSYSIPLYFIVDYGILSYMIVSILQAWVDADA